MENGDEKIVADLVSTKVKSDENFEKGITFLAGGTLVLSLTFIEKIIKLNLCVAKWTLVLSWGLLAATLLLNLISHQISSRLHSKTIRDFVGGNQQTLINSDNRNKIINGINWGTSGTLISGIIFLIIFCSLNLYSMPTEDKPILPKPISPDQTKGMPITITRNPTPAQQPVQPTAQPSPSPQPTEGED